MRSFIDAIIESIPAHTLPQLHQQCYIFPSKRASIIFAQLLKEKYSTENFIFPEIITIQDFIYSNTTFIVSDDWTLLLELHQLHNALTNSNQAFEKFLPWGNLILKDFDECDKYLVDAVQLFSLLKAQKDIDETFSISEEVKKYIEEFILTKSAQQKESIYREKFIKTWSLLGDLYPKFQAQLKQNNLAYEGMAYREVLENIQQQKIKLPYTEVHFCGFNALSFCEETLFKTIEQQYKTNFWWDADETILNNKFHEAGNFLRRYQTIFNKENSHWIFDKTNTNKQEIQVIGISSDIGQTEYVANQLPNFLEGKTAIVLCNEHLLSPLLYKVDTNDVNITMGYSLSQSELYLLLQQLLSFYANARISEKNCAYFYKDIEALVEHFYFSTSLHNKEKLKEIVPFFVPYMSREILREFFPVALFSDDFSTQGILKNVLAFIQQIKIKDDYFLPIKSIITEQLQALISTLQERQLEIDRKALPYIVKHFLSSAKIPFETNKQSSLQIMGFLETRILDFDNLFILSLNDDYLPGTNKTNSFIPYNLRKYYGLPTFDQFDGINAYHFYRLLKRAKNIQLIYNNQLGDNAGEMSRFIRQIQYEQSETQKVEEFIATYQPTSIDVKIPLLEIPKTATMLDKLRQREFSPSALKLYIRCPLQFYLRYVAKIDEPETLEEDIDAAVFGNILHKTLELIYQPYIGKRIKKETILTFTADDFIRQKIADACVELALPKEITQGSNQLQLKIIERLIQKTLTNDAKESTLLIEQTENKFIWKELELSDNTMVSLQGTFDRIDRIDKNSIRIVDYKTGKIKLPDFPEIDEEAAVQELLDKLFQFKKDDYSAAFQGLLYALIYHKLYHCPNIYVAFHHAKQMKSGLKYLNNEQPISIKLLELFEERLIKLFDEMLDIEMPFIQSDNENAYQYSAYADLLGL